MGDLTVNQLDLCMLIHLLTLEYEIKFADGTHRKVTVNIIAKNMFAQVDSKENQYLLRLQEITDQKTIKIVQFQYPNKEL